MVKRRTLGEGLTPEEEAFLKGPSTPPESKQVKQPIRQKEPKVVIPEPAAISSPTPPVTTPQLPSSTQPPTPQHIGMVGLNTRVEPAISAALLRASVERKIQRKARAAVQDIVNEALTEWLAKAGYLPSPGA